MCIFDWLPATIVATQAESLCIFFFFSITAMVDPCSLQLTIDIVMNSMPIKWARWIRWGATGQCHHSPWTLPLIIQRFTFNLPFASDEAIALLRLQLDLFTHFDWIGLWFGFAERARTHMQTRLDRTRTFVITSMGPRSDSFATNACAQNCAR